MNCSKPYKLKVSKNTSIEVGCGRCTHCRIQRSKEFTMRLIHELPYWEKSCFVTLTYDEEHTDGQLHKTHLQDYFRELRRSNKIKYFACGEYGENTGRPHYHAIIFGHDEYPHKLHYKSNNWPFGNTYVGEVTKNSCRYVCDYIFKAYDGQYGENYYNGFTKPFRLLSKGIGRKYIESNDEQILQRGYLTLNGIKQSIPRYYLKRLNLMMEEVNRANNFFGYLPEGEYKEQESAKYQPLQNRLQNERNLKQQHRLKKGTL